MVDRLDPSYPMPKVDELIQEINKGKRAIELLHEVWNALGPYAGLTIEGDRGRDKDEWQKTWNQVGNFFGFDDSE